MGEASRRDADYISENQIYRVHTRKITKLLHDRSTICITLLLGSFYHSGYGLEDFLKNYAQSCQFFQIGHD